MELWKWEIELNAWRLIGCLELSIRIIVAIIWIDGLKDYPDKTQQSFQPTHDRWLQRDSGYNSWLNMQIHEGWCLYKFLFCYVVESISFLHRHETSVNRIRWVTDRVKSDRIIIMQGIKSLHSRWFYANEIPSKCKLAATIEPWEGSLHNIAFRRVSLFRSAAYSRWQIAQLPRAEFAMRLTFDITLSLTKGNQNTQERLVHDIFKLTLSTLKAEKTRNMKALSRKLKRP